MRSNKKDMEVLTSVIPVLWAAVSPIDSGNWSSVDIVDNLSPRDLVKTLNGSNTNASFCSKITVAYSNICIMAR